MVTTHARFTEATRWRPVHPTYREGLRDLEGASL